MLLTVDTIKRETVWPKLSHWGCLIAPVMNADADNFCLTHCRHARNATAFNTWNKSVVTFRLPSFAGPLAICLSPDKRGDGKRTNQSTVRNSMLLGSCHVSLSRTCPFSLYGPFYTKEMPPSLGKKRQPPYSVISHENVFFKYYERKAETFFFRGAGKGNVVSTPK